jgi:NhaA family Na+:H+ antiporter
MRRFLRTESLSGALLLIATVIALVWANAAPHSYVDIWRDDTTHRVISDWLLPIFFLVVGLEIRRELDHPREVVVPALAALGGMVVPALLFIAIAGARGWAVPTATDIAFAVGVLTLLGPRVPTSLKIFLLTLAIADDLGAVVVIGAFYGGGVHPTVAAALVGVLLPERLGARIESPLHALSSIVIVPLFALANAGIHMTGGIDSRVAIGVVVARLVGKVVGVTGAAWLAVRAGLGSLPRDTTWPMIAGVGLLAGMGFTVSLFVADLAFDDPTSAKLGVLLAALVAGVVGAVAVAAATRERATTPG